MLRLDDWKRIGQNQKGQKCNEGRGWYGLKGACERGKRKRDDLDSLRKASKTGLADKIRKAKGMRDRLNPNDPRRSYGSTKAKSKISDLQVGDSFNISATNFRNVKPGNYQIVSRETIRGRDVIGVSLTTSTGKVSAKARKLYLDPAQMDKYLGDGVSLETQVLDRKVGPKKTFTAASTIDDGAATRVGKSLSEKNVVTEDSRFNHVAVNKAFDAISTPGARERVAQVRDIIEGQGIQAVFNSSRSTSGKTSKLVGKLEAQDKRYQAAAKLRQDTKDLIAVVGEDPRLAATLKRSEKMIATLEKQMVGNRSGAAGYTRQDLRHVVVSAEKHGKYDAFEISSEELAKAFPAEGKTAFTTSSQAKGATGDFLTYIHEVGHQVQWIAESNDIRITQKAPNPSKNLTSYSSTNRKEQFAEHFALWVVDADELKRRHPEMHDYISEAVSLASQANRRIDALDNTTIAKTQDSKARSIAQTPLGVRAFRLLLNGGRSAEDGAKLKALSDSAVSITARQEVGWAIEAFIVDGGAID